MFDDAYWAAVDETIARVTATNANARAALANAARERPNIPFFAPYPSDDITEMVGAALACVDEDGNYLP